jgi:hypothetical protein
MTMPPIPTWYQGREQVGVFLSSWVLTGSKRWRLIPARANGQLAFGAYAWDEKKQAFVADAVKVVGLRGTQIEEITAFRTPDALHGLGLPDTIPAHWQSQRPGRSSVTAGRDGNVGDELRCQPEQDPSVQEFLGPFLCTRRTAG